MKMRAVVLEGPNKFHAVNDYPKPVQRQRMFVIRPLSVMKCAERS